VRARTDGGEEPEDTRPSEGEDDEERIGGRMEDDFDENDINTEPPDYVPQGEEEETGTKQTADGPGSGAQRTSGFPEGEERRDTAGDDETQTGGFSPATEENISGDSTESDKDTDARDHNPDGGATSETEEGSDDDSPAEKAVKTVAENIIAADSLVFVVDGKRLVGKEPMGPGSADLHVQEMSDIAKTLQPENAIPIVTKADYLIDDFQEEKGYDERPTEERLWPEFRSYLTERLKHHPDVRPLMNIVGEREVLPVYYQTKEISTSGKGSSKDDVTTGDNPQEESEFGGSGSQSGLQEGAKKEVPKTNENGELMREGFATVLDEISRDV
jgi:hypothetical protein